MLINKLITLILIFTATFVELHAIEDSTSRPTDKNEININFRTAFGFISYNKPLNITGVSYKIQPELEYFFMKRTSVCLAVNYLRSNNKPVINGISGGGLIIERSFYAGLKYYKPLKRNQAVNINAGYHYGSDYMDYYGDSLSGGSVIGGNFSVGLGFQNFPLKWFGRENKRWGYFLDMAAVIPNSKDMRFNYSCLGLKFRL